jgi:hypothetical protein
MPSPSVERGRTAAGYPSVRGRGDLAHREATAGASGGKGNNRWPGVDSGAGSLSRCSRAPDRLPRADYGYEARDASFLESAFLTLELCLPMH